jgi:hypothetical protein
MNNGASPSWRENLPWLLDACAATASSLEGWSGAGRVMVLKDLPLCPHSLLRELTTLQKTDFDITDRLLHGIDQYNRMITVYGTVLSHFGQPFPSDTEWWIWYSLTGELEKYLKYSMADLLARSLKQVELPNRPDHFYPGRAGPFVGNFGNYLRRKLIFPSRIRGWNAQLAFSLYQSKAGSLPVSEEFVSAELSKAVTRLTTLRESNEDNLGIISEAIEATVEELFGDRPMERDTPSNCLIPSLRSSVQSSRAQGGAYHHILGKSPFLFSEVLLGYVGRSDIAVLPVYGPDPLMFQDLIEDSRFRARQVKDVLCRPVGLLEPFKVRVITRGDADVYHLSRRWQRIIHPKMARHPTFNLTRSPIRQWHLDHFSNRLGLGELKEPRFIVSGDYEAATDNLHPDLSNHCLDLICQRIGVPLEDQRVLRLALTGHRLLRTPQDVTGVEQKWGQLMGSPISFPILCIINAAVTRLSMDMEGWFGPWSGDGTPTRHISQYPLLINGDDVGFEATDRVYARWKELTADAGLIFSLGKNYTSPSCLILNSQLYQCVDQVDFFGQRSSRLWRLPHLEVGLLFGQVKGQSREESEQALFCSSPHLDSARSLSQMAWNLISPWDPQKRDRLMATFLRFNNEALKKVPRGMSWFLPRQLGGLGLPATRKVVVTSAQLKLAAYLSTRPLQDPSLRDLVTPELPSYLRRYLDTMSGYAKILGWEGRKEVSSEQVLKREKDFPHLESWALGNPDPDVTGSVVDRVQRRFRSIWSLALQSSLSPMNVDKALAWRKYYQRINLPWC